MRKSFKIGLIVTLGMAGVVLMYGGGAGWADVSTGQVNSKGRCAPRHSGDAGAVFLARGPRNAQGMARIRVQDPGIATAAVPRGRPVAGATNSGIEETGPEDWRGRKIVLPRWYTRSYPPN